MGAFPSGQWGQTVNLLLNASVVRIHQLPPKRTRNLGCGFSFVLELVGFEQVGRPQTAKSSPADCSGCRKTLVGASIARPCPFVLQENCPRKCVAVVSWRATNGRPYTRNRARMQFFDGLFLLSAFSAVFRMLNFPAAGDRGAVHAHPVKSETGHRIAAGTCNPGGKQV